MIVAFLAMFLPQGSPILTILNNITGRKVRVKVLTLKNSAHRVDFPAQTFLYNQNKKNSVLFTIFALALKQ